MSFASSPLLKPSSFVNPDFNEYSLRTQPKNPSSFDKNKFLEKLIKYNDAFSPTYRADELGFFYRIDFSLNNIKFIKGDLHGDSISLDMLIAYLKEEGILDDELKIKESWKGKIAFIFLGDFIDRGPNDLLVLDLLITLKMQNPDDVFLLRGNHEDRRISEIYASKELKELYKDKKFSDQMDKFFLSLPLFIIAGTQNDFAIYTHGGVLIDEDIFDALSDPNPVFRRTIKIKDKIALSDRIIYEIPFEYRAMKLREIGPDEIHRLELQALTSEKHSWILSAIRIQDLILRHNEFMFANDRLKKMSTLTWGDIASQESGPNYFRNKGLKLSAQTIQDYFNIVSSSNRKLRILIKGHGHEKKTYSYNGKELIFMLPVAGELEGYDHIREPIDISYLIKMGKTIDEWTIKETSRKRGLFKTEVSKERFFYNLEKSRQKTPIFLKSSETLDEIDDDSSDEKKAKDLKEKKSSKRKFSEV